MTKFEDVIQPWQGGRRSLPMHLNPLPFRSLREALERHLPLQSYPRCPDTQLNTAPDDRLDSLKLSPDVRYNLHYQIATFGHGEIRKPVRWYTSHSSPQIACHVWPNIVLVRRYTGSGGGSLHTLLNPCSSG